MTAAAPQRAAIQYGTTYIPFDIERSERRATVALAVHGGRLVVTAPARATVARLEAVVRSRALWVKQQLRAPHAAEPAATAREFVSGETVRYLGRQYRLRVVTATPGARVHMDRGWLVVPIAGPARRTTAPLTGHAATAPEVRAALAAWLRARAEARLPERVAAWARRLGMPPPRVLIRDQRRRWGSCNHAGEVRLNWRIVQAPHGLIDYVIAHELVHGARGDVGHSPAFWAALGRVMPDYDLRRDRLRQLGPSLEW